MKDGLKNCLCLLLILLGTTHALWAQSTTATIAGTVTDESAAVLPNAQIAVTNTATGVKRSVSTDAAGRYIVSQLPPGTYDVSSSLTGFGNLVRIDAPQDHQQSKHRNRANQEECDLQQAAE